MALHIHNTLSRKVEPFTPLDPDGRKVGMYCCGPTVHDFAHIGNFRTFVFAEFHRRHAVLRLVVSALSARWLARPPVPPTVAMI